MEYRVEDEDYFECAAGLWFPMEASVRGPAPGLDEKVFMVEARYLLYPFELRYALIGLHVYAERSIGGLLFEGSPEIDTATHRAVRLAEIRSGLGDHLGVLEAELDPLAGTATNIQHQDWENGGEELSRLRKVAQVYARGSLSGRKPQQDVSDQLQVSIATAGRLVRRARNLSLLSESKSSADLPREEFAEWLLKKFPQPYEMSSYEKREALREFEMMKIREGSGDAEED